MTWLQEFAYRVSHLFRRDSEEQELAEEIESHLQIQIQEFVDQGLSPEEAQQAARFKFGSSTLTREDSRAIWSFGWLETLWQDVRYGVRILMKSRGFTVTALLSLAIGIGATTAVFSVVKGVLLTPPPYADPERLVMVWDFNQKANRMDYPEQFAFLEWQRQNQVFAQMAEAEGEASRMYWLGEKGSGAGAEFTVQHVNPNTFSLLGVEPLIGRDFIPDDAGPRPDQANTVIISHRFWKEHFNADRDVVGQALPPWRKGGGEIIVGIMPPGFWIFPWASEVDVFVPTNAATNPSPWLLKLARLKPEVSVEQAQQEIDAIRRRTIPPPPHANTGAKGAKVQPLLDMIRWGATRWQPSYGRPLLLLFGVVGFVLLIVSANVANLLLSRSMNRRKEIAARGALGASRGRLVRQLVTESLLLSLAGGFAGVLVANFGVQMIAVLAPDWRLPEDEIAVDFVALLFTLAISILTVILFGLAPALQISNPNLNVILRSGQHRMTSSPSMRLRGSLVVLQLALGMVLLTGAGLMINSFMRLLRVDLGYRSDGLLSTSVYFESERYATRKDGAVHVTQQTNAVLDQVLERVQRLPGVASVAVATQLPPITAYWPMPLRIHGRAAGSPGEEPWGIVNEISPDYFRLMDIPLLQGRPFTGHDTEDSEWVAIVNEALVREYFPQTNAVGQFVHISRMRSAKNLRFGPEDDKPRRVVGVVGDVRQVLRRDPMPEVYVPYQQHLKVYPGGTHNSHKWKSLIVRTTGSRPGLAETLRRSVADIDPQLANRVTTVEEELERLRKPEDFWFSLLGLFAIVAVLLAAVGLYGVVAYSVVQRSHEFGIRMALGAERSNVLKIVLADGLRLSLIGVAIGLLAALGLTQLVESQLYGVTPTDPVTFSAVAIVLVAVALLASYLPARRAAGVDPMVALRHE